MTAAQKLGIDRHLLDDEAARWSAAHVASLADGREVPVYGSDEWARADLRLQLASALRAGEAHRRETMFVGVAVADAIAADAWAEERDDAESFRQVSRMVRHLAVEPTHAELVARRTEVVRPGRAA